MDNKSLLLMGKCPTEPYSLQKEFSCGTLLFAKGQLRRRIKIICKKKIIELMYEYIAETAISTSTLAAQNLSVTFENVYSNTQCPGLARV